MILEASLNAGFFKLDGVDFPEHHFALKYDGDLDDLAERNFSVYSVYNRKNIIASRHYSEIDGVTSWDELSQLLNDLSVLRADVNSKDNGSVDVNIQDQYTPPFDLFFSQAKGAPTTSTADVAIDDYTINVTSVANIAVNDWIGIFSGSGRYFWGEVKAINDLTLTLDSPFDFAFASGINVLPTTRNLAVDGSTTPQIFSIQAGSSGLELDVTRVLLSIVTTNPIALGDFGDIADGLLNGIVLRTKDGVYRNLWNIKTNYQMAVHSYDIAVYEQVKQNDVNAINVRFTYAGQSKHGVTIRIKAGDELQIIVQDDLSSLLSFVAVAEGSEVSND